MERTPSAGENESIKRHARAEADYRDVDMTQAVMERIGRLGAESAGGRRLHLPRRSAAVVMLGGIALLGALTAYAASDYAHVRYLNGRIDIKAVPAGTPYAYPPDVSKQFVTFRQQVRNMLQPGQMLAYYIADDKLNAYDKQNSIKFESDAAYDSYEDYLQKMKQVSGPRLERPAYLPKGYQFKQGQIFPRPPLHGDDSFDRLQADLLAKAASATGDDKLIVEPVIWNRALGLNLAFRSGNTVLNLTAFAGPDDPRQGSKTTMGQPASATSETVRIGDQEALYMSDDSPRASMPHYLFWYDEKANVYYTIFDSAGSKLTRQDMLRIAESMINQLNH